MCKNSHSTPNTPIDKALPALLLVFPQSYPHILWINNEVHEHQGFGVVLLIYADIFLLLMIGKNMKNWVQCHVCFTRVDFGIFVKQI